MIKLADIDLTKTLDHDDYDSKLIKYQNLLRQQQFELEKKGKSVIIAYEGWDASGKGGNIKRLTAKLDPRGYNVIPVVKPTAEEYKHHYLWRFWRRVPKTGYFTIFDRTWYGRVLVERVEGFAKEEEWQRAYEEINNFEEQLTRHGIVVFKFWVHISKDEQLKRFEERASNQFKKWKITEEDWRNREKWDAYTIALDDIFAKTSTKHAPWKILAGNSKYYARVSALRHVTKTLKKHL